MNFPIHDNLGEVNPEQRRRDFRRSATPEEFVQHSQGKTFEQLNSESQPRTIIHQPIPIIVDGGVDKKFRYVEDPTDPGGVIDMLHFMNAAQLPFFSGELVGAAVEVNQARKGDRSAFQRSDFKSNFLGTCDGSSDGNELFTLDELGISRIKTVGSSTNVTNASNQIAIT